MITFDPFAHEYRNDGKLYPSVTQILKDGGYIDTRWYAESGRDRGSQIHEATEGIDRGDFKIEMFEGSEIFPWLLAYEKFKKESGCEVLEIEKIVSHNGLEYAGTLDRILKINGDIFLADLKTGTSRSFWHGLQLAAYKKCLGNESIKSRILFLKKTGKYSLSDGVDGHSFDSTMFRDYWDAIAKKSYYDRKTQK